MIERARMQLPESFQGRREVLEVPRGSYPDLLLELPDVSTERFYGVQSGAVVLFHVREKEVAAERTVDRRVAYIAREGDIFCPAAFPSSVRKTKFYPVDSVLISANEEDLAEDVRANITQEVDRRRTELHQVALYASPNEKIAYMLSLLGRTQQDGGFTVSVHQTLLADLVGIARQTTNGVLTGWQKHGLVTKIGRWTLQFNSQGKRKLTALTKHALGER